jgi:outer membrane beta-barrel protein
LGALVRVAVVLGLAFGLANGTVALAAPALGASRPGDNPFEDRGDASADRAGEAAPARADDVTATDDEDRQMSGDGAATDADPDDGGAEPESALHGLACLEGDATGGHRKGVQRRDFLKRHKFELSALGGFYASDALSSTYSYGGALAFYPSEDFGVETLVTRSPMRFRLEEPFTAFDQETHFVPTTAWQAMASLLWSPIHAKLRFSDTTIVHGDMFALAGAGRTFDATVQGLTWEAGAGIKLYFGRFFAFRLDLRDFLLPQEVLGRARITNNVNVLAGLSLWLG